MAKKTTIEDLAKMMKKGFDENTHSFKVFGESLTVTGQKTDTALGLLKLTRQEMAKDEDMKQVRETVNSIYKMLDSEAKFIQH